MDSVPVPGALEAMAAAVEGNDAARLAAVLDEHPELRSQLDRPLPRGAFGATPLLTAVYRSNREMVDVLLRAGADINARSHWWAGSFGVLDHDGVLADFLIERGAFVDVHAAARLGMRDRVAELIGSDPGLVHARGGDGQTPLHFASTIDIAQFLLDRGADIDARDVDHESTPAQWMIRDRQEVARFLVDRGCHTDILMASALGDLERVRTYLDGDPSSISTDVSERYFPKRNPHSGGTIYTWTLGGNKTAHVVAREFGRDAVFQLLMERTPDPLKLAIACELEDAPAIDALLASRPDLVGALPVEEQRRLPAAAQGNRTEVVRLMLRAGWPSDVRGQFGATALHWAAWHGNADMVRVILRHQPPLEATETEFGGTPMRWACHGSTNSWHCRTGDYGATVEALLDAGAERPAAAATADASEAVLAALSRESSG
jgi:ankyrin repeat protein